MWTNCHGHMAAPYLYFTPFLSDIAPADRRCVWVLHPQTQETPACTTPPNLLIKRAASSPLLHVWGRPRTPQVFPPQRPAPPSSVAGPLPAASPAIFLRTLVRCGKSATTTGISPSPL